MNRYFKIFYAILVINFHTKNYLISRCYAITKGSKIITRGLLTKEACDEKNEANTYVANVISALIKIFKDDDSITYKCCSWSCCNYNATTLALASAPTDADGKYAFYPDSTDQQSETKTTSGTIDKKENTEIQLNAKNSDATGINNIKKLKCNAFSTL